jgi:hypothetical protein
VARIKKAEREAVEAVLMEDFETAAEAAEAAIRALDEVRAEYLSAKANRPFVLLTQGEGTQVFTYGPYATEAQAERARKSLVAPNAGWIVATQKLYEVGS